MVFQIVAIYTGRSRFENGSIHVSVENAASIFRLNMEANMSLPSVGTHIPSPP
jgi:hypothetical protein